MNIQEQYRKSANHFMNETYEMDTEGDMAIEAAKESFSNIINTNDFLNMMKKFIDMNDLAPDEETSMLVIEEFKNTILPEVESLIRTIGR
jgi:hypothetical protein